MKNKIKEFDKLTQDLEKANEKYDEKSKQLNNRDGIEKAQKALKDIKLEVFKLEQRIGIIQTVIPHKEEAKNRINHLYDDISEMSEDSFT